MSHPTTTIKHVALKQTAQDNTVSPSVLKLETELAEISKALVAFPARQDAPALRARQAAIGVALRGATTDGQ